MPHTDLTIGAFFEEQVRRFPHNDFIVYPDRGLRWSFSRLQRAG